MDHLLKPLPIEINQLISDDKQDITKKFNIPFTEEEILWLLRNGRVSFVAFFADKCCVFEFLAQQLKYVNDKLSQITEIQHTSSRGYETLDPNIWPRRLVGILV